MTRPLLLFRCGDAPVQMHDQAWLNEWPVSVVSLRSVDADYPCANVSATARDETVAVDFNDDVVLMGHDGPGHIVIAEGKIKVGPLKVFHGKVGTGLSVEMPVRHAR